MPNAKPKIMIWPVSPSNNQNPSILYDQFIWRKSNKYNGESIIGIGDVKEPVWWNRPVTSNEVVKQESDGLYSYNLPYIYRRNDIKQYYNILVNKNSIPVIFMIKMQEHWTSAQRKALHQFVVKAAYNALIALGIKESELIMVKNDLIYHGRKFIGNEEAEYGGWYGGATIITLRYTDEKDIFARLSGKYPTERGICGIQEESNDLFTKEQFLEKLIAEFEKLIELL